LNLEVVVSSNYISCIILAILRESRTKCERKVMGGFELKSIWVNTYKWN